MKYKVGDKVRVRKDLKTNRFYGGDAFTTAMGEYLGKLVTIDRVKEKSYEIRESNYYFTDEMLEPYTFTKSELMTGDVVETENGKTWLVLLGTSVEEVLCNGQGFERLKHYGEDLKNSIYNSYDVKKVFRATNGYQYKFGEWKDMPIIWEREKPIVEITLEEIAKLKGVEVSQIRIKDGEF